MADMVEIRALDADPPPYPASLVVGTLKREEVGSDVKGASQWCIVCDTCNRNDVCCGLCGLVCQT